MICVAINELETKPNIRQPKIIGDRIQLQQVLLNLITNAVDAMKATSGARVLRLASEVQDNGDVVVSVADTGTGIKPQDIERIFHPLFTTKSDGMGMGLSIAVRLSRATVDKCRLVQTPQGNHLRV